MKKESTPLTIPEFKDKLQKNCLILDTRDPQKFTEGFIPSSVSIGLKGDFEGWIKSILPVNHTILLVTEVGKEAESTKRLAEAGFSDIAGYLNGGFQAWQNAGEPIDLIIDIEADELAMDLPFDDNILVVDVRPQAEFSEGHVKDATNIPLKELADLAQIASLEEDQNIYVHSGHGYQSVIASSLLKKHGYNNIRNITGGWESINEEEKIPTEKSLKKTN